MSLRCTTWPTVSCVRTCWISTLPVRTQGWFIEDNQTLTITLPTDFELRPPFNKDESSWYLTYHKTDWHTAPKILLDKMVGPAGWTKDGQGNLQQYPSYGFFGYASEIGSARLEQRAIHITSTNLHKIGKGIYPSGVLIITRCRTWQRLQAGGNDAMQRTCRYAGAARGKAGHAAMHSNYAAVSHITVTFDVNRNDMNWISVTKPDEELAHGTSHHSKPSDKTSRH